MGIVINVDTGVSFTHAVATDKNEIGWAKVETNQGNPKRSLFSCLQELARKLDLTPAEMLAHTLFIRWSSSIASELLAQGGRGKLGLVVSKDLENVLRSSGQGETGLPSYLAGLVRSDMIVGIKGEIDRSGRVIEDVSEEEVSRVMERLVDSGATGVIVSLSGSFFNSLQEKRVREIMRRKYPAHYLGSTDLFLGSEVSASPDDRLRTHTAILNAYLHRDITHHANGVEDAAHDAGYKLPLLITHGTGAVATQVQTKALDLWNSSIAGEALGSAALAKQLYGIKDFIYMDVGGGSRAHIGIISQGKAFTTYEPVVGNIPANVPTVEVISASGGGSSIARVESKTNLVTVGPFTAALSGGPAAYVLGGPEPTVIDADLLLGYLDPNVFLGDARKLNRERSVAAIREKIVSKTGQSVEAAAYAIAEAAEKNIAEAIKREMERKKIGPARLNLFALGGAGGMRCCGCASLLGIGHIIVFHFNAVASAVLSSMVDLFHTYQHATKVTLRSRQGNFLSPSEYDVFNKRLQQMEEEARADIQTEGLKSENARFVTELKLSGSAGSTVVEHPLFGLRSEAQVVEICNLYDSRFPDSGAQGGEVSLESVTLKAQYPVSHAELPVYQHQGTDPAKAIRGERQVYWGQGLYATPVYQQGLLASGNVVPGPAVIEAPGTTILVPPGWKYTGDQYLNGNLEVQK